MLDYVALSLPVPFIPSHQVNAYLIKQDPITLIDCGTYTAESKLALSEQLGNLGLQLADIKQILITHAHPDHYGLAAEIQRISQAPVFMHSIEVVKAQDRLKHLQRIDAYAVYAGLPEDIYAQLEAYNKWEVSFVQPPEEIVAVADGHIFSFDGGTLEGILTPGHASGHLCYYQREEGLLFAGDFILNKITPNPVLEPSLEGAFTRKQSLVQYMQTISQLQQLDIKRILPGHGKPILDVAQAWQRINRHHQKRKEEVSSIACRHLVFNPYQLAMELYPTIKRPVDYYLAISEILGYLDVLESEGHVAQQQTTAGLVYSWLKSDCLNQTQGGLFG